MTLDAAQRASAFETLKRLSFLHSATYFALLMASIGDGPDRLVNLLGWAHGVGWIAMCVLVLTALRLKVVSLPLAVAVAVIGGVGPFIGSLAFVREQRRTRAGAGV